MRRRCFVVVSFVRSSSFASFRSALRGGDARRTRERSDAARAPGLERRRVEHEPPLEVGARGLALGVR